MIYSAALMGMVLFALRRWTLPVGSVTLLISVNTLMMCRGRSFCAITSR
jgi:hypothetical protein